MNEVSAEQKPASHVETAMRLAAWTICSTCCEAHASHQACPRCAVPAAEPTRRAPAAPAAPNPGNPAAADPSRRIRLQAAPPPAAPVRSTAPATLITGSVFVCGLVLGATGILPVLGIVLCAVPVGVQSVVRVRERRAERAALADLGLHVQG